MDNEISQTQTALFQVKKLLKEFLEAVEGRGNRPLVEILADLDLMAQKERKELPGDLRHYLERRSYQKAAAMLNLS